MTVLAMNNFDFNMQCKKFQKIAKKQKEFSNYHCP